MGKIEEAIKKINTEIQKEPNNRYLALVGENIIDCIMTDDDAGKVLQEGKTLAEAMQKKLDKAKKDAEKAKKEAAEAQAAIEAHESAQKEAEEAALQAKEELKKVEAETEKKLRLAGRSEITVFKVHFEAVQAEINKMLACVERVEEAGEAEEGAKLRAALKALCQRVCESL